MMLMHGASDSLTVMLMCGASGSLSGSLTVDKTLISKTLASEDLIPSPLESLESSELSLERSPERLLTESRCAVAWVTLI